MIVRNAEFEDMKRLGHIMSVSFQTAFSDFVTQQTLDACAREESCTVTGLELDETAHAAALENINVETLTPIEAMNLIWELKGMLSKKD